MPAPRKSGAFLVLFWHAKEYNHSAVQLLHDTLHFLTRVPLFQQLVPDRTVAPPLAAQARRAVRHQRPAGNTALPGRQPAAGKTALRLGAGIRTSLPGTLGRFRLLERPLALGNVQLLRGKIVAELLLAQRVLILPFGQLVFILLLGQAVLPLQLASSAAPRRYRPGCPHRPAHWPPGYSGCWPDCPPACPGPWCP